MHLLKLPHNQNIDIRPYRAGDEVSMFMVHAALTSAEAGDLVAWTTHLDDTLEVGGAAWVAARGRRMRGYALVAPVPGLPGVFDLTGGVNPPWQEQGTGSRLLATVKDESPQWGVRRLSSHVTELENDTSRFLLHRGFYLEHEECLLELDLTGGPPTIPDMPGASIATWPQEEAIARFLDIYERSFEGRPWSQPFSSEEVTALLVQPEDLLFAVQDDQAVGVAWVESNPDGSGRIEPFGVAADHQGRGVGRWLLQHSLRELQNRGLQKAQVGLWRTNSIAMNLYKRAGFAEVSNWYYLACDLHPK